MRRPFKDFKTGTNYTRREFNRVLATVESLDRLTVAAPLQLQDYGGGKMLTFSRRSFWAVITGRGSSSSSGSSFGSSSSSLSSLGSLGSSSSSSSSSAAIVSAYAYAWREVQEDGEGGWIYAPGGLIGETDKHPAYEVNRNLAVEVGTVVRMRQGLNYEFVFEYCCGATILSSSSLSSLSSASSSRSSSLSSASSCCCCSTDPIYLCVLPESVGFAPGSYPTTTVDDFGCGGRRYWWGYGTFPGAFAVRVIALSGCPACGDLSLTTAQWVVNVEFTGDVGSGHYSDCEGLEQVKTVVVGGYGTLVFKLTSSPCSISSSSESSSLTSSSATSSSSSAASSLVSSTGSSSSSGCYPSQMQLQATWGNGTCTTLCSQLSQLFTLSYSSGTWAYNTNYVDSGCLNTTVYISVAVTFFVPTNEWLLYVTYTWYDPSEKSCQYIFHGGIGVAWDFSSPFTFNSPTLTGIDCIHCSAPESITVVPDCYGFSSGSSSAASSGTSSTASSGTSSSSGSSGPCAFWKFESNLNDEYGNFNGTGTNVGYATGFSGNALSVSGNGYMQCSSGSCMNQDLIHFECRIKMDVGANPFNPQGVVSKRDPGAGTNEFQLYTNNYNFAWYIWTGSGLITCIGGTVSTNTWYHVECYYDSTNGAKLYVDGSLVATAGSTGARTTGSASLRVGDDWYGNGWNGLIDEVKIY